VLAPLRFSGLLNACTHSAGCPQVTNEVNVLSTDSSQVLDSSGPTQLGALTFFATSNSWSGLRLRTDGVSSWPNWTPKLVMLTGRWGETNIFVAGNSPKVRPLPCSEGNVGQGRAAR
jgi:hypothetical protein